MSGAAPAAPAWERLDPRMLLVHPIQEVGKFLPILVGLFLAGGAAGFGPWTLLGAAAPVALGVVRYLTTTWRITPDRVELRRGVLQRHTLSTPPDRVRTVDLTSSPIHRILGLATVVIGTGSVGGDAAERLELDARPREQATALQRQGELGIWASLLGQEAVAAGMMTAIRDDDNVITAYRDHGLAIAKGVSVNSCMAELYGKATGNAKGKGGSMHFFGKEQAFYGGHGIVGAQIGTGAGLAFAEQYRGTDNVCLTFFGDGAARQGMLHETFNMAVLWQLGVQYIQGYFVNTPEEVVLRAEA